VVDYLICKTNPFPVWGFWQLNAKIDDEFVIRQTSTMVHFTEANAPTINRFYPHGAAPAKSARDSDFENAFWTGWYDLDQNDDGSEDERRRFL